MRRIKIKRDPLRDLRDKEIEKLQKKIDELEHNLYEGRAFSLNVKLKCISGNASFTGCINIINVMGDTLAEVPVDGYFRSNKRKEQRRDFSVPMIIKYGPKKTYIDLDDPKSPDWQKRAKEEMKREQPEHLLRMRTRRRI